MSTSTNGSVGNVTPSQAGGVVTTFISSPAPETGTGPATTIVENSTQGARVDGHQEQQQSSANRENDDGPNGNKRPALTGQWRTPPSILFFPGMSAEQQQQQQGQVQIFQQHSAQPTVQQIQHANDPSFHVTLSQQQQQQQQQQSVVQLSPSESHLSLPVAPAAATSSTVANGNPTLVPTSATNQTTSIQVEVPAPPTQTSTSAAASVFPMVTSIPHSTEDYAKALQEAYRRGAEAAAMAAAAQAIRGATNGNVVGGVDEHNHPQTLTSMGSQSHHSMTSLVSTVSCPDFTTRTQPTQQTTTSFQNPSTMGIPTTTTTTTTYIPAPTQHQHHSVTSAGGGTIGSLSVAPMTVIPTQIQTGITTYHHYQPVQTSSVSTSLMPPPAPVTSSVSDSMQYQQMSTMPAVQTASYSHPTGMTMIHQPSTTSQQQQQPQQVVDLVHQQTHQQSQQPIQQYQPQTQRSVSMPDMSSYAVQQEEEKRQKRLARNRASARLRRLRKKNLVDAYEIEVGILEKTLQMLKDHEWGGDANKKDGNNESRASALAAALSMDRGQQILTVEERKQAATDILSQQLSFLEQLESLLQEQFILHEIARIQLQQPDINNPVVQDDNFDDLRHLLNLSDEQARDIQNAAKNWEDEWNSLQTVKESLIAMKDNDWLWNDGCVETADQFLRILHKNQISKFLLWCDHNVEAIEELDCVNARPVDSPTAPGPIFSFGVDSHPGEFLDEDK